ncbi:MAG: response regulator [bacterium]
MAKKILIVDDNELNRKIAAKIVELLGHEALLAAGGVEALQIFNHNHPDIILMDCIMPEMDGFETTKLIRQIEQVNEMERVPIIAVTASDECEEEGRNTNVGMDYFISKPIDAIKLSAAIKEFSFKEKEISDIDFKTLMNSSENDADWAKELFEMFIKDTSERLEQVNKMIQEKKIVIEDAIRHFHTIKSSAASVGALKFSQLAKKMETFARNGEETNFIDNFSHAADEFKKLISIFENEMN